jgi:hypothetical protein
MNILRRKLLDGDDKAEKTVAAQAGARRIELTVEQEWVSMLVRGRAARQAATPQPNPKAPAGEVPAHRLLPPASAIGPTLREGPSPQCEIDTEGQDTHKPPEVAFRNKARKGSKNELGK